MKFVIAGLGSIGRRHLRNLRALGENDILLLRTGRSSLPDDELTGLPTVNELREALASRPQAVIISTPTSLHLDIAIPAAEVGCHLFLEKPISNSMERVDELRAAVRRGGGQVYVGFQFRFHPGLRLIHRLLDEGVIGRVASARAHWGEYLPAWHPWEDYRSSYAARADLGGGVILTLCHPLDYLRWLMGDVEAVWALAGKLGELDITVEDTAEIGLAFQNGALGSVHLDYLQRPPAHHLEIIGAWGTLRWNNADGAVHLFRAGRREAEVFPAPDGFERNDMFLEEMKHFVSVVRGEEQPACTLEDGVRALQIALAAHASAREGKMIPLEEG